MQGPNSRPLTLTRKEVIVPRWQTVAKDSTKLTGVGYVEFKPGDSRIEYLDRYASMYEKYRIISLKYVFSPVVGTTIPGYYVAGIDPDPGDLPLSVRGVSVLASSVRGPLWKRSVLQPNKFDIQSTKWTYCSNQVLPSTSAPEPHTSHSLVVGMQNVKEDGETVDLAPNLFPTIEIHYTVQFVGAVPAQTNRTVAYTWDRSDAKWFNVNGEELPKEGDKWKFDIPTGYNMDGSFFGQGSAWETIKDEWLAKAGVTIKEMSAVVVNNLLQATFRLYAPIGDALTLTPFAAKGENAIPNDLSLSFQNGWLFDSPKEQGHDCCAEYAKALLTIERLEEEILGLENKNAELEHENTKLISENADLKTQIADLTILLDTTERENAKLHEQVHDLQVALDREREITANLNARLNAFLSIQHNIRSMYLNDQDCLYLTEESRVGQGAQIQQVISKNFSTGVVSWTWAGTQGVQFLRRTLWERAAMINFVYSFSQKNLSSVMPWWPLTGSSAGYRVGHIYVDNYSQSNKNNSFPNFGHPPLAPSDTNLPPNGSSAWQDPSYNGHYVAELIHSSDVFNFVGSFESFLMYCRQLSLQIDALLDLT